MAIFIGPDANEQKEIDVLLICPRHPMPFWALLPHGPLALAQFVDREGFRAAIWDYNADPRACDAGLRALLSRTRVRWVGISLFSTQLVEARRLARLVRDVAPEAGIIVGGQHVAASSVESFPEADLLVAGEGERALLSVLRDEFRIEGPRRPDGGLRVLSGKDHPRLLQGEIVEKIDEVPLPDREIWKLYASFGRLDRLGLIMARGCPFDCTFCHFEERSRTARRYAPETVAEQVRIAHEETGLHDVFFLDDIFTLSRPWVNEVCGRLEALGLDHLHYGCFSHVRIGSPELYQRMARAGFKRIHLGIESGEEHIRRRMHKNFTDAQIRETVRMVQDAGMEAHCLYILGYTGETIGTMQSTLRLAESLKTTAWFSLAQPLPGTDFLHEAEREGTILERDLSLYENTRVVYLPEGVTLEEMHEVAREAERLRMRLHKQYATPWHQEVVGAGS